MFAGETAAFAVAANKIYNKLKSATGCYNTILPH
jgi:hypothetical protein